MEAIWELAGYLWGETMRDTKVELMLWRTCALAISLIAGCGCVEAATGGAGCVGSPYQIRTADQLLSIGSDANLSNVQCVLANDIDLDPNLPGGKVFTQAVVGYFGGSLDGNGHVIRNLVISAPGTNDVGLFGSIGINGKVQNLRIEDANVTGRWSVGVLAGDSWGYISSCYSTGHVKGDTAVGGLVGYKGGVMSACYSTCTVTGTRLEIGGLVGKNSGTIVCCYASGRVTGPDLVGGLVGSFGGGFAPIYFSYSTAHVTGTGSHVGGLAGNVGMPCVRDCYFLAQADGGGPDNHRGAPLTAGQMRQRASFAGWDFWGTDADRTGDLWFMPKEGCPALAWQTGITGLQAIPSVAGVSLAKARTVLQTAGFTPGVVRYDFDRTNPKDLAIRTYPSSLAPAKGRVDVVLSRGTYDWGENPGDGTAANPYQIQTASQLESLADDSGLWDRHFVLTADIDMVGRS